MVGAVDSEVAGGTGVDVVTGIVEVVEVDTTDVGVGATDVVAALCDEPRREVHTTTASRTNAIATIAAAAPGFHRPNCTTLVDGPSLEPLPWSLERSTEHERTTAPSA